MLKSAKFIKESVAQVLAIVDGKIAKSPRNLKVNSGTIYEWENEFSKAYKKGHFNCGADLRTCRVHFLV